MPGLRRWWNRPITIALSVFISSMVVFGAWSFADPLAAAPDEQAHVIRAVGLVHGAGQSNHGISHAAEVVMFVPTSIAFLNIYPVCWHFRPEITPSCDPPWPTSEAPVRAISYVGHYPPAYYALVGLPSLVSAQRAGVYAMRLVSAGLSAAALALAAFAIAAWGRRRSTYLAFALGLTPIAYQLASSVNPGGLEITGSICLWTLVAIWGLDRGADAPRPLVYTFAGVAAGFCLIRGLSVLWLAVALLVLVSLLGFREVRALLARREVLLAGAFVAVVAILAGSWVLTQGALQVEPNGSALDPSTSNNHALRVAFDQLPLWWNQSIGKLGWLDTGLPAVVHGVFDVSMVLVIVLALLRASLRVKLVLVLLGLLTVAFPVVIVASQATTNGITWQGRNSLPLVEGVLVLSTAVGLQVRSRRWTWVRVLPLFPLLAMAFVAFGANLRRYVVGVEGLEWFWREVPTWVPPIRPIPLLWIAASGLSVLAVTLGCQLARPDRSEGPLEQTEVSTAQGVDEVVALA